MNEVSRRNEAQLLSKLPTTYLGIIPNDIMMMIDKFLVDYLLPFNSAAFYCGEVSIRIKIAHHINLPIAQINNVQILHINSDNHDIVPDNNPPSDSYIIAYCERMEDRQYRSIIAKILYVAGEISRIMEFVEFKGRILAGTYINNKIFINVMRPHVTIHPFDDNTEVDIYDSCLRLINSIGRVYNSNLINNTYMLLVLHKFEWDKMPVGMIFKFYTHDGKFSHSYECADVSYSFALTTHVYTLSSQKYIPSNDNSKSNACCTILRKYDIHTGQVTTTTLQIKPDDYKILDVDGENILLSNQDNGNVKVYRVNMNGTVCNSTAIPDIHAYKAFRIQGKSAICARSGVYLLGDKHMLLEDIFYTQNQITQYTRA